MGRDISYAFKKNSEINFVNFSKSILNGNTKKRKTTTPKEKTTKKKTNEKMKEM